MNKRRLAFGIIGLIILAGSAVFIFRQEIIAQFFAPTTSDVSIVDTQDERIETAATNMSTPWSITFLPSGDMLVTEREGKLMRVGENDQSITISGVRETSEGGLLGVALDPDFSANQQLYLYYTTDQSGQLTNQIDRYELDGDRVKDRTVIIDGIPAASNHNGGAISFGPDRKLYVTTGDAAQEDLAQDTDSLAGKILRLNPNGSIPSDNPFENAVWSYGHRNPQGIAWDDDGQLWSVEHGPSGAASGRDELNKIQKGANYGWPVITGDETREGMIVPIKQSGDEDTWAPAGVAYLDGSLYFAGLRGQSLYRYDISSGELTRSLDEYGRLRAVTAHENSLYVSTSNRDGRGSPRSDDDKILRISY